MENFRLAIEDCGLGDLGYMGDMFTWSNNRECDQFTKERLDRAFSNPAWQDLFIFSSVSIGADQSSDHRPIIIKMDCSMQNVTHGEKPFRHEVSWALREECPLLVKEEWKKHMLASNKLSRATEGLQRCKDKLTG